MKKITFLLVGLLISNISSAQVTIIEITEDQATVLLDSLKKNRIGHTHTKQWSDDFVNIEDSRNEYLKAVVGITQLIMPDQINVNKEYNKILSEFGNLYEEIRVLEEREAKSINDLEEIALKNKKINYIREVEFKVHPHVSISTFERLIDEFYADNLTGELGDTVYLYKSGLPEYDADQKLDEQKKYTIVSYGDKDYAINTYSVNFGIICNRKIEGKMYANRWK
jgi:hypothetical protein